MNNHRIPFGVPAVMLSDNDHWLLEKTYRSVGFFGK